MACTIGRLQYHVIYRLQPGHRVNSSSCWRHLPEGACLRACSQSHLLGGNSSSCLLAGVFTELVQEMKVSGVQVSRS